MKRHKYRHHKSNMAAYGIISILVYLAITGTFKLLWFLFMLGIKCLVWTIKLAFMPLKLILTRKQRQIRVIAKSQPLVTVNQPQVIDGKCEEEPDSDKLVAMSKIEAYTHKMVAETLYIRELERELYKASKIKCVVINGKKEYVDVDKMKVAKLKKKIATAEVQVANAENTVRKLADKYGLWKMVEFLD